MGREREGCEERAGFRLGLQTRPGGSLLAGGRQGSAVCGCTGSSVPVVPLHTLQTEKDTRRNPPGQGLSRTATQARQLAATARMQGRPSSSRLLRREQALPMLPTSCCPGLPAAPPLLPAAGKQAHPGCAPPAVGTDTGSAARLTAARRAAAEHTGSLSGPAGGAAAARGVLAPLLQVGVLPALQGASLPTSLRVLREGQRTGLAPGTAVRSACCRWLRSSASSSSRSLPSSTTGSIEASCSVASAASTSTSGRRNLRLVAGWVGSGSGCRDGSSSEKSATNSLLPLAPDSMHCSD